jgi:hypothetical protein
MQRPWRMAILAITPVFMCASQIWAAFLRSLEVLAGSENPTTNRDAIERLIQHMKGNSSPQGSLTTWLTAA